MSNSSNIQFFVLLGTVLAGVIWQRVDIHQLSGRIDRMNDDMKQFYRTLGKHEEAIDTLKAKS